MGGSWDAPVLEGEELHRSDLLADLCCPLDCSSVPLHLLFFHLYKLSACNPTPPLVLSLSLFLYLPISFSLSILLQSFYTDEKILTIIHLFYNFLHLNSC